MTISYPLALPSASQIRRMVWKPRSVVGVSESPFSFSQQVYVHQGEAWQVEVDLIAMERANAEAWAGWLLALNGREGTFLLGDPKGTTPRGTWAGGSPLVQGAGQSGKSLAVDGVTASATALAGDWLQLGSGSTATLHKVTQDVTFSGGGAATLDIWPRLRSVPADNAAVTLSSAKGRFRMGSNAPAWDVEAIIYGISFDAMEAL